LLKFLKVEPRNVVAEVNSSVLFECKVAGEVAFFGKIRERIIIIFLNSAFTYYLLEKT